MNLATIIDGHPDDDPALVDQQDRVTYGELRQRVAVARGGLKVIGVQVGDRVALLGENSVELVVGYLALVGMGAVAVLLNPQAPLPAIRHEMDTVGATLALIGRGGIAPEGADAVAISDLIGAPFEAMDLDPHTLAVLMFTSGTAGASRAAMLSHGNLLSNLQQNFGLGDSIHPSDVVLNVLPLHHIFGLNVALGLALIGGASVVLANRFDPVDTVRTIIEEGVTIVPGAPPMWIAWSTTEAVTTTSFAKVRLALTGAARMPEDDARAFADRSGVALREGYGLTEASPVVTTSMGTTPRLGSIGRVLPGVTVRLVDEDGEDALDGDTGEVLVKGPNVFLGYWNDPEATAKVLRDGWLHTGDVAIVDGDGFLYLVDRSKDLIIVSGFNVYPAEVEDTITSHPSVHECAVVGVPHATTGEAIKAYVVLEPGAAVTAEELAAHCKSQVARYKCPSEIVFIAELPKGPSGKVLRRLLR
jgi:long-chain acyl-CoA synthetase